MDQPGDIDADAGQPEDEDVNLPRDEDEAGAADQDTVDDFYQLYSILKRD